MTRIQKEERVFVKPEGYIDEERKVFVCTNYQECIDAGILTFKDFRLPEEIEKSHEHFKELFEKYRPQFIKPNE